MVSYPSVQWRPGAGVAAGTVITGLVIRSSAVTEAIAIRLCPGLPVCRFPSPYGYILSDHTRYLRFIFIECQVRLGDDTRRGTVIVRHQHLVVAFAHHADHDGRANGSG